jgi:hypothetical protein
MDIDNTDNTELKITVEHIETDCEKLKELLENAKGLPVRQRGFFENAKVSSFEDIDEFEEAVSGVVGGLIRADGKVLVISPDYFLSGVCGKAIKKGSELSCRKIADLIGPPLSPEDNDYDALCVDAAYLGDLAAHDILRDRICVIINPFEMTSRQILDTFRVIELTGGNPPILFLIEESSIVNMEINLRVNDLKMLKYEISQFNIEQEECAKLARYKTIEAMFEAMAQGGRN